MKDIGFWVDFVAGNSNKLQNLGLEGKISWAFNVSTLRNLEIFNSENVRNKECVHIGPMALATLVSLKDQILGSNWKNHQLDSSIFHGYPNKQAILNMYILVSRSNPWFRLHNGHGPMTIHYIVVGWGQWQHMMSTE